MSKLITKNDLKAILDDILPHNTVETITPTFTTSDVTNPIGTLVEAYAKVIGNVCQLTLGVKHTSAVSVGSNVFHQKITTSKVLPEMLSMGCGYYGSTCGVCQLLNSGDITIRITGAQLAANSTIYITLTYII